MSTKKTADAICEDFTKFSGPVLARFQEIGKGELYVVGADKDSFYQSYLEAFPAGSNPQVKERTLHDCQTCKRFVRYLGRVVGIKDGKKISVWGGIDLPHPYKEVAEALDAIIQASPIKSVFRTKERSYGVEYNYDSVSNEKHHHFHATVESPHFCLDPEAKRGEKDSVYQVMSRGLNELRVPDLKAIKELIDSNELYRGEEKKAAVVGFMELRQAYQDAASPELFVWENLGSQFALFRSDVIGTLAVDLAEGKDFEQAVKAYEAKVAPMNYKRTTAPISQSMVENAIQTLTDLGLHGAMNRRYARLSDISVRDVLFVDNEAKSKVNHR